MHIIELELPMRACSPVAVRAHLCANQLKPRHGWAGCAGHGAAEELLGQEAVQAEHTRTATGTPRAGLTEIQKCMTKAGTGVHRPVCQGQCNAVLSKLYRVAVPTTRRDCTTISLLIASWP